MSHHTPGPWRVAENHGAVVADADSGHDDPWNIEYYGGHLIAESIDPRNRPIIAAAPELLVALRDCGDFLTAEYGSVITGEADGEVGAIIRRINEAIAKAEGRA
jgi:hypothetical protein